MSDAPHPPLLLRAPLLNLQAKETETMRTKLGQKSAQLTRSKQVPLGAGALAAGPLLKHRMPFAAAGEAAAHADAEGQLQELQALEGPGAARRPAARRPPDAGAAPAGWHRLVSAPGGSVLNAATILL